MFQLRIPVFHYVNKWRTGVTKSGSNFRWNWLETQIVVASALASCSLYEIGSDQCANYVGLIQNPRHKRIENPSIQFLEWIDGFFLGFKNWRIFNSIHILENTRRKFRKNIPLHFIMKMNNFLWSFFVDPCLFLILFHDISSWKLITFSNPFLLIWICKCLQPSVDLSTGASNCGDVSVTRITTQTVSLSPILAVKFARKEWRRPRTWLEPTTKYDSRNKNIL